MSLSARVILTFWFTKARAIQQFTLIQESEDDSIAGPSNSTHSDNIQTSVVQGSSGFGKNELRLFPPPLFSRQTIPQLYKFSIYILSFFFFFRISISYASFCMMFCSAIKRTLYLSCRQLQIKLQGKSDKDM